MSRRDSAGLSPKRMAVANLLAVGRSVAAAAREASVGERTIHTWIKESAAFQAEVARLRSEQFQRVADRLGSLQSKALDKLTDLLDSERESTIIAAIRLTLENAASHRELTLFDTKLADLERRAAGLGDGA